MHTLFQFIHDEEGADLAEYALVLVLISIAAIVAMTTLGGQISAVFQKITDTLNF